MTEVAKALNAEEAIQQIHSHIASYLDGGPDRKEEDVELARDAGLKVEAVSARWDDAQKTVRVSLPPLEVVPPERPVKAEAPTVSVASWRRDRKPKAEGFFKTGKANGNCKGLAWIRSAVENILSNSANQARSYSVVLCSNHRSDLCLCSDHAWLEDL